MKSNLGFTLVELIITLIILGILSVTVIPKFFGPALFDSYTARDQAMSALRTMQLRAMQMTDDNKCHKFIISTDLIAPPSPITDTNTCSNTANAADNPDYLSVTLDSSRTDVTFDADNAAGSTFSQIAFDDLGKPCLGNPVTFTNGHCTSTNEGNCDTNGCKITVGEVAICISGEGAIYGC
ncbi:MULTISPECIES: prepilin-type N-terminal cleavage/methylation domain-containing protein [unclassified Pseudoalteromonas]|uniref:prepilin-type N-terminal cleavage/methylation domain-containing protein n=1 Tax=unclassified Pseudoalteromonas TaxID=194690 RepID=UPI0005AAD38E|nr:MULTISPECIES: prepilin-type N-terminal cleavage/methylation domain-containing protein [unclassified Pseudoalteromonas]